MMSPAARQIVSNLTDVLVQTVQPKRIILFGSQARGDAALQSDFDIMVVEETPGNVSCEAATAGQVLYIGALNRTALYQTGSVCAIVPN